MSDISPSTASYRWLDVAAALEQLDEVSIVRDMLTMVVASLEADLQAVSQALAAGNTADAQGVLHPLKGFLPIFCTSALAEQVANTERACKSGDAVQVAQLFNEARPHLQELANEIRDYLQTPV